MKMKMVLFTVLATLLVSGAEKSAASQELISYSPDDVKIVGVLNYGQKSEPVAYADTPLYRAFLFAGQGDDQIDVRVTGASPDASIAVADQSLKVVATGAGHLSVSLPNHGPDAEMYYVVFKNPMNRPVRVQVNKTGGATAAADATR
jgi:hypothetical protein